MTRLETAYKSIAAVRQESDSCILFCSLGKDSIVLLDMLYPRFDRIVCVFMYFVEGLEHIERWIGWAKAKYPRIEFDQVPHWNLSYILRSGLCCVPQPATKLLKLTDVVKAMRLKYSIEYVFLGMKKADSMNRNLMLRRYEQHGYINNGMAYPLAEWTQRDVMAYIRQHKLPNPVRYSLNASSGLGFNPECFIWLRENYPQDLERIYETFPLSERILWEHDRQNNQQI